MIRDTKFLTPSIVYLYITTATISAHIIRHDVIFFHAVVTNALPKWNSCIAKGTCRCYYIAIGLGCYYYQQYRIHRKELLNLVGLLDIQIEIFDKSALSFIAASIKIMDHLLHNSDTELNQNHLEIYSVESPTAI